MAERNTTNLPMKVYNFATTLKAPADKTNSEKRIVVTKGCTFVYTVSAIDTNVDVAVEVSADGTNFGIDPIRPVVQHTANGTFTQTYIGAAPYVALFLTAETGGTAVVVTVEGAFSQY